MFPFPMSSLKIVMNMRYLDFSIVENTANLELGRAPIKPNPMLIHMYVVNLQVLVEQSKAMLNI